MRPAPLNLRDGVALVTGAASGIGAALAEALARRGMHLALADRQAGALDAVADRCRTLGVRVSTHALDVTDAAACAALPSAVQQAHGRLSVLVNNAGVALGGSFEQVDEADFDWLMAVNFGAVVRLTRLFLPMLKAEPAAQIVNLSSIFGIIAPPGQTAYCASKFAVRGFSESLRHELEMAGSSVSVTLVHPGGVRTAIATNARVAAAVPAEERQRQQKAFEVLFKLSSEEAAEQIAQGLAARAPRLLVGRDARQAAWLQRLMPVRYWALMARGLQRKSNREA
jgi:short-subunit dehydrogenase